MEVREIATEEELRAIADDLYGAYVLTAYITVENDWTPVGSYFSNYEFYDPAWWTYAFHGSFDGAAHTVSGLKIKGAKTDTAHYKNNEADWHNDGDRADGCTTMFGAISGATIQNLILEHSVVDVSGGGHFSQRLCVCVSI